MQPDRLSRTQHVRRQGIIKAAITVINAQGYSAASIATIAKQANTSKSTVLYHFATKDELIQAVIGSIYADGAAHMEPRIAAATTFTAMLRAYITSNIEYIVHHTAQIAATHQIVSNHENLSAEYGDNPIKIIEEQLRAAQAQGEFGSFDPHVMAVSLRLVIDGSSFYILQHPTIDVTAYAASICQLFEKATSK